MIAMITQSFARTIGVVISVITVNYVIIFPVIIAICYMTYVMKKGKKTMIDAQRLDSQVRGPIHTTFGMIVSGLVTLRQYDKLSFFEIDFINNLQKSCNASFSYIITARWMGFRLDMTAFFFAASTAFCVVAVKGQIDSA